MALAINLMLDSLQNHWITSYIRFNMETLTLQVVPISGCLQGKAKSRLQRLSSVSLALSYLRLIANLIISFHLVSNMHSALLFRTTYLQTQVFILLAIYTYNFKLFFYRSM